MWACHWITLVWIQMCGRRPECAWQCLIFFLPPLPSLHPASPRQLFPLLQSNIFRYLRVHGGLRLLEQWSFHMGFLRGLHVNRRQHGCSQKHSKQSEDHFGEKVLLLNVWVGQSGTFSPTQCFNVARNHGCISHVFELNKYKYIYMKKKQKNTLGYT